MLHALQSSRDTHETAQRTLEITPNSSKMFPIPRVLFNATNNLVLYEIFWAHAIKIVLSNTVIIWWWRTAIFHKFSSVRTLRSLRELHVCACPLASEYAYILLHERIRRNEMYVTWCVHADIFCWKSYSNVEFMDLESMNRRKHVPT